jgi:hypothetical protein
VEIHDATALARFGSSSEDVLRTFRQDYELFTAPMYDQEFVRLTPGPEPPVQERFFLFAKHARTDESSHHSAV